MAPFKIHLTSYFRTRLNAHIASYDTVTICKNAEQVWLLWISSHLSHVDSWFKPLLLSVMETSSHNQAYTVSSLLTPGIVLAYGNGQGFSDVAYANFYLNHPGYPTKCYYPKYNGTNCSTSFASILSTTTNNSFTYLDFIPLQANILTNDTTEKVLLQVCVTWNLTDIIGFYGKRSSPQLPYWSYALFDPVVSFQKSFDCGLVSFREIPALGSTTFSIAATTVNDDVGILPNLNDCPWHLSV
jgi:hypothetical protein